MLSATKLTRDKDQETMATIYRVLLISRQYRHNTLIDIAIIDI